MQRLAGSVSSAIGMRCTLATSAKSFACTGDGARHHPITGVTTKSLTGTQRSGSCPKTTTPDGSSPVSSWASRNAAAAASASSSSRAPPGNAGSPACVRIVRARSISKTSGPVSLSPSNTKTAEWRPWPSGGTNLVMLSAVMSRITSTTGCSQGGNVTATGSSTMPTRDQVVMPDLDL